METNHSAEDIRQEGQYIPKSYQFERDMDGYEPESRMDNVILDEDANKHFMHHDMRQLIEDKSTLASMIRTFLSAQVERLNILKSYSEGNNYAILNGRRRLEKEKADYRVRHNIGGYISNFITGYILSKPVTMEGEELDDATIEIIEQIQLDNDSNALDYDLAYDTSRYGRAYELHYRDKNGRDKIVLIDPQDMFVIRDTTVERAIIGAVHCPTYSGLKYITVYTDTEVIEYKPTKEEAVKLEEVTRRKHAYGMVPVVEWQNNRHRIGDFENVITLIDAYDSAESDTANYMSDLNDAMLVVNGDFNSSRLTAHDMEKMKRANMLLLESGIGPDGKQTTMNANYIYKQYDVAGTEAYKTRLMNDIFRLANVPNLEDDRFYSGNSGIALEYKLIGLKQLQGTKENFYSKALRRRYQLLGNVYKSLGLGQLNVDKLYFVFHPNIPRNVWVEVESFIKNGGEISQTTLLGLTSFTDNETEKSRLDDEQSKYMTDEEIAFNNRKRDVNG